MSKRITWTLEPDDDSKSLIQKAIVEKVGRKLSQDKKSTRGLRTKLINQAIRNHFKRLDGKREFNKREVSKK